MQLCLARSAITHTVSMATEQPGTQHRLRGHRGYTVLGFTFPHSARVMPSFYLLMSRGPCWAAAQTHLADGVHLGTWEGPGTWQMAPAFLAFVEGLLGSSPDFLLLFFFFFLNKALIFLDRQYNMVDMLTVCYLLGDLSKFLSLSPSFLSWKITSHGSYPL